MCVFACFSSGILLSNVFIIQKSEEIVTRVGLNPENEIIHTLSFLAGVMIWSQVYSYISLITHFGIGLYIYSSSFVHCKRLNIILVAQSCAVNLIRKKKYVLS